LKGFPEVLLHFPVHSFFWQNNKKPGTNWMTNGRKR
jgi:hypothetical protein